MYITPEMGCTKPGGFSGCSDLFWVRSHAHVLVTPTLTRQLRHAPVPQAVRGFLKHGTAACKNTQNISENMGLMPPPKKKVQIRNMMGASLSGPQATEVKRGNTPITSWGIQQKYQK